MPRFPAVALIAACAISPLFAAEPYPLEASRKIADEILAKMTLEEKVRILGPNHLYSVAGIPRLGLPEFRPNDGPCSVRPELTDSCAYVYPGRTDDCATALPPLSTVAATWDPAMGRLFGETLSSELRARGKDVALGPSINIMRTPINGRTYEYTGEDPYLAGKTAVAVIQGIQSNDIGACVKHYACNNQELARQSVDVIVDERALREIYLAGFETAVKEGGVLTVMGAYNKIRGQWACENDYLLNQVLRKEWGFTGSVISDWGGVHDAKRGALGGTDLCMGSHHFFQLGNLVKKGVIPESVVDEKVRRLLTLRAQLRNIGPEVAKRTKGEINTEAHRDAARRIALESITLLKNDAGVLPLDAKSLKTVLVFGKPAKFDSCVFGGSGEGKPLHTVTALEGIQKRLGAGVNVEFVDTGSGGFTNIPSSCVVTADPASMVKGWEAAYFNNENFTGTPVARRYDATPEFDWKGAAPLPGVSGKSFSARWVAKVAAPESGEYTLSLDSDDGSRLFVDDQPVIELWRKGGMSKPAVAKIKLEKGREYTFRLEYFQSGANSGVSLKWKTPSESAGTATGGFAQRVKAADAVIVFTGTTHDEEQEGRDRKSMKLSEGQDALVESVAGLNPRTVIVNNSGAPVAMPWIGKTGSVVQFWYGGQEGGDALAAVLFGDHSPSGKLPCTFPVKLEDTPAHVPGATSYNPHRVEYKEGVFVGYRWFDAKKIEPLFPFGHGLSYTTFQYGEPTVTPGGAKGAYATVRIPITNTGKRAGAEVAQLYLNERAPKVERPERELKGFARLELAPGETKVAEFPLTKRDFSYWSVEKHDWQANTGAFEAAIGSSSRDLRAKAVVNYAE